MKGYIKALPVLLLLPLMWVLVQLTPTPSLIHKEKLVLGYYDEVPPGIHHLAGEFFLNTGLDLTINSVMNYKEADLLILHHSEMKKSLLNRETVSLNDFLKEDNVNLSDFFLLEELVYNSRTKEYIALPYNTDSYILFYRTDIFNNSVIRNKFYNRFQYELLPPEDTQSLKDLITFFSEEILYSVIPDAVNKALNNSGIDTTTALISNDLSLISRGKGVMGIIPESRVSDLLNNNPYSRKLWISVPPVFLHPQGYSIGISIDSIRKNDAYLLLKWLTSEKSGIFTYLNHNLSPARLSVYENEVSEAEKGNMYQELQVIIQSKKSPKDRE